MAILLKRPTSGVSEFSEDLCKLQEKAHLTHLRQYNKSGWQHNALNTLYDDVVDIVDGIIESWQGIYGLVDIIIPETSAELDAIMFVQNTYDYIQTYRGMFSESWIQNEIDNICKLLAQTLYRLKYVQ